MKILVIESNFRLAERVVHYLRSFCAVDISITGSDGIRMATKLSYTAILVDISMPDMTGYQICQSLRERNVEAPILVLSHPCDTKMKIDIFECGADGYILKPLDAGELAAQLKALARRRSNNYNGHIVNLSDLTLDITRREVLRDGLALILRRKEFDILEYLVLNKNKVVSRQDIISHLETQGLGKAKKLTSNTVDVHVKHLRAKIDRPGKLSYIRTVYGIGYMIEEAAQSSPIIPTVISLTAQDMPLAQA